jgi:hypothetical protein
MTISQSARHGQLSDQGCVIIWQANEGDHAGPLHNIMSAKQLRDFSQVRDHLVRDSAPSAASKTVNFELGVLRKSPGTHLMKRIALRTSRFGN